MVIRLADDEDIPAMAQIRSVEGVKRLSESTGFVGTNVVNIPLNKHSQNEQCLWLSMMGWSSVSFPATERGD